MVLMMKNLKSDPFSNGYIYLIDRLKKKTFSLSRVNSSCSSNATDDSETHKSDTLNILDGLLEVLGNTASKNQFI